MQKVSVYDVSCCSIYLLMAVCWLLNSFDQNLSLPRCVSRAINNSCDSPQSNIEDSRRARHLLYAPANRRLLLFLLHGNNGISSRRFRHLQPLSNLSNPMRSGGKRFLCIVCRFSLLHLLACHGEIV